MDMDPGIVCFQHCGPKIFCFVLPEYCPVCKDDLSLTKFSLLPFRVPYPFIRAAQYPCAVVIKPTNGDFLNDYYNSMDLHIGVTTSTGIIVEFDRCGLRRHRSEQWGQCLLLDQASGPWTEHWDSTLLKVCKQQCWTPQSYREDSFNCYTFVLTFLQTLEYGTVSEAATCRTAFCEKFIVPRTTAAVPENDFEKKKRCEIEAELSTKTTTLERWRQLAKENYGLVNDDLRRKIWPLLMDVDPNIIEIPPTLDELSQHPEYNQVILDVNRSLKRFPPGIPYERRVALQDQLTVLILRVIIKYPYLRYYQGYHDVAITFLLVVGDAVAFRIMERLSTVHLRECMEPTMEKTSHRLNFIYPIIEREHIKLFDFLERSSVGTMFALPWYLTWFGHSLNQYRDVVRLYDYFLASPPLAPLYVAAALVVYREEEIFSVDCDMAGIHCLLTAVPDNLPFEIILIKATEMYEKYPPEGIEKDVQKRIKKEMEARKRDEERARKRQLQRRPRGNIWLHLQAIERFVPAWIPRRAMSKYKMLVVSVSVAVGVYAYYLRNNESYSLFGR